MVSPTRYMQSFIDGITIWAYNVLPALFPFMVLTALTLKLQTERKHSFTKQLFGIDCDNIFLTGLLCGYPVGAKAIADSNANENAATLMSSFCSTAGPIFMIATVGAKLLQNTIATVILIAVHFVSSVLNGLLYRNKQATLTIRSNSKFTARDVGDTITNSALSIISVGGLIALFYMLSDMIKSLLPQSLSDNLITAFIIGLLEMTNGVFGICRLTDVATATVLCSTLLSFGGLCVFAQCYAFLGIKHVSPVKLLKIKVTQSAIATILSYLLSLILL